MRDILFKELTSSDKRKRLFSICEAVEKDGILTKVERRSIYLIKEKEQIKELKDLPRVSVFKVCNTQRQEERLSWKVVGNFYVVTEERIFYIIFIHSFKIEAAVIPIQNK